MKNTTASDIATYFIVSFQKKNAEISNLKLQKLLYYAQAWHLALFDEPVFADSLEAWVHGPVIPSIFRKYRRFGWNPIVAENTPPHFSKNIADHIREVIRVYGKFDAVTLERMTHGEDPWRDARRNLAPDEPSNRVITHEAMKKFYTAKLNG